jgi:hypothetical protein
VSIQGPGGNSIKAMVCEDQFMHSLSSP